MMIDSGLGRVRAHVRANATLGGVRYSRDTYSESFVTEYT